MAFSRREFLKLGSLAAVATTATGCSTIGRQIAANDLPETLAVPTAVSTTVAAQTSVAWRLLNRAAYGPRPGDLDRVTKMGAEGWLEEQLHPEQIEDTAVDLMIRGLTLYHMDASQLIEQEPADGARELIGATIVRALYSNRQLYETMVEFWSDHFNIYLRKVKTMPLLKILDDRDVIRPYALGKFGDLLRASVHSPAMLVYLDNVRNNKSHPNENYARELMELHTLGVHAGYTQADVQELARVLTGWTMRHRGRRVGEVVLNREQHDFGEKRFLGHVLPAGRGVEEIEEVIQILLAHPATAEFIATKLVRRFVADEPPASLVSRVADTFRQTDGDIKSMLRVIFLSEEFATAPPKLKRPFTYMISALRALHADLRPARGLGEWLELLGQLPFHWPPPNGYPDVSPAWATNLLPRWNFALALLHNELPGVNVPFDKILTATDTRNSVRLVHLFAQLVLGRPLDTTAAQLLQDYVGTGEVTDSHIQERLRDAIALMIASPAFQWT
ncbi:MAG: DUF1800 domain-containing protein [Chloroflexi bacterium]|nr:MAG: DUF1800 domain-containing protein [Chloroflexota bacterium]